MNVKGQGALEYLLLIGGAVLVAAIVIALVTGIPGTTIDPSAATKCASNSQYAACNAVANFSSGGSTWDCIAKEAGGVTNATSQANMASCTVVWVSTP